MLSFADVARGPGFTIETVTCLGDHKGWSDLESPSSYRLVLARRGRFRRRSDGVLAEIDPTVAYLGVPGEEEHFSHPCGGDVCTLIGLSGPLWRVLTADTARLRGSAVYVDAGLELAHRRLLADSARGDVDFAVAERLAALVSSLLRQLAGAASERAARSDRVLVAKAREAIAADLAASRALLPLAGLLQVSPYRLSRAFTRELGVSLTRYRNRVRVGKALDRLEGGEPSLAALAADLGFADQAHLCRTMGEHLGKTPTALRRLLRSPKEH